MENFIVVYFFSLKNFLLTVKQGNSAFRATAPLPWPYGAAACVPMPCFSRQCTIDLLCQKNPNILSSNPKSVTPNYFGLIPLF